MSEGAYAAGQIADRVLRPMLGHIFSHPSY